MEEKVVEEVEDVAKLITADTTRPKALVDTLPDAGNDNLTPFAVPTPTLKLRTPPH